MEPWGLRESVKLSTQKPEDQMTDHKGNCAKGAGKSVKIRRLIAKKMEEAWQSIPHFHVTMTVDMTDVIRLRQEQGLTINDYVLAAAAQALKEHPWVNSCWNGEQGVEVETIGLAMAVATDCGLYYPVVKNCEKLSLKQISARARALSAKAHQGNLDADECLGGTFTVTNMGMLGVESFAAIITPPQAAVLAVGTVRGETVVNDQGEPAVAPVMRMTLGADHRLLDGADAAEFLGTIKSYLEAPVMLNPD
jgi:pyruvate dehydrogenase E2 component (dihydrolipoamide acetyltransferase)